MARKIKTHKTPEQRHAEAAALHETIAQQVEALATSEAWSQFLAFAGKFHRYSLNNLLLILAQRENATQVAGYRTWQKLGRQVRKGERGIRIFGGREVTETIEDETTGEETERRRTRFFPVSVFDLAQTDPIEGAEPIPENPADAHQLTGDDPAGIAEAVTEWLTGQGWTIEHDQLGAGLNGYTSHDDKRIVIAADISRAQAAKTTLHEAAHALMHAGITPTEYHEHRGQCEVEAESVAHVVAGILGLDTSAYSVGYVAGWSKGDADLIRQSASRVLAAAHRIAEAITDVDAD